MKKFLALAGTIGFLATTPANAFLGDNLDQIIENTDSKTVSNVVATPGNQNVMLFWDPKKNDAGDDAEKYRVDFGTKSVANGDAEKYEFSHETPDNVPTDKIENLENGKKYFFAVTAIFPDGSETPPSAEISATPIGEMPAEAAGAPVVLGAISKNLKTVEVLFSKKIVLPENPLSAFSVTDKNGTEIELSKVTIGDDSKSVLLEMENPLIDGDEYTVTASAQITDTDGAPIESGSTDSATFSAAEVPHAAAPETFVAPENTEIPKTTGASTNDAPEKDTTPPEDVTDFVADFKARVSDFLVTLKWTPSKNTAGDLDYQILYRSENNGKKWDNGRVITADTATATATEKPKTTITYKLTVRDKAGNESVGVIRSVSLPALPKTGSGIIFLAGIALFGAAGRKLLKK